MTVRKGWHLLERVRAGEEGERCFTDVYLGLFSPAAECKTPTGRVPIGMKEQHPLEGSGTC